MKMTHGLLAVLWVFASTVEAHHENQIAQLGYGGGRPASPDIYPPSDIYDSQRTTGTSRGYYIPPRETVNIYRHPDDGALHEAPYITVPVQPGTGNTYQGRYGGRR